MSKKVEKLPVAEKLDVPEPTQPSPQELLAKVKFKPQALVWENFHAKQPDYDRWIYLWCAFGKLSQNIFVTYRNALGQYDLPHPTKQFPAHAWSYADNPQADEKASVEPAEQPKQ
jgi:hypothetical protein